MYVTSGVIDIFIKKHTMAKLHTFKDIVAHRCNDDGKVDVQIKWDSGELTWEPFANIQKDAPEALAEYGQTRKDLLGQAPWDSLNIDSVTGENDSVTGENMYTFKRIVDHRHKRRCLTHWEKSIDIQIEWDTGDMTWEPFENIANDASSDLAEYALEQKLLEHKQWRNLAVHLPEYTSSRYELKKIRNHRPRNRVPRDNGIELEIEWSNGEITWESADMINKDAPQMFEQYAKRRNILTDFKQQQHDPIILSALEEGSPHTFLVAQRIEFICNHFVEVMKGHELKLPISGNYEKVWIGYDSDKKSDVWLPAIKISCIKTFCDQVKDGKHILFEVFKYFILFNILTMQNRSSSKWRKTTSDVSCWFAKTKPTCIRTIQSERF